MRITIVYRYFWPDTPPYATMLREIATRLAGDGHTVRVLTAQPSYGAGARLARQPKFATFGSGVTVNRCPLLPGTTLPLVGKLVNLANWFWFLLWAYFKIAWRFNSQSRKTDLIWTASILPVVQAWMFCRLAKRHGIAFLYHIQDIYPEAEKGRLWRMLAPLLLKLDNQTLRAADQVVTLSGDMVQTLKSRQPQPVELAIINNFSISEAPQKPAKPEPAPEKKPPTRLLFAGNIGRFQGLEVLVDAMQLLESAYPGIELHFLGHGRSKAKLQSLVRERGQKTVHFHDFIAASEVNAFMSEFDIGIVSIVPHMLSVAFPSKVFTYLEAGLPILAIADQDSSLEKMLLRHNAGMVCPYGDGERLSKAILDMVDKLPEFVDIERKTREEYAKEFRLSDWSNLIKNLENRLSKNHV